VLERNNLGRGILDRKTGLLYGQGPMLYRTLITTDNECVRRWTTDYDVQQWLDTWDYRAYIRAALSEYVHFGGAFSKYYSGRAVKVGKAWISRLECLEAHHVRLVHPGAVRGDLTLADVKYYLTGDFAGIGADGYETLSSGGGYGGGGYGGGAGYRRYPAFDPYRPERYATAIRYHREHVPGRAMYALPSYFGSLPWLENAADLPDIIRHLNQNMIAAAYLVHIPEEYWNQKEGRIREMHPEWMDDEVWAELSRLNDELTRTIADVMAGKRNAGKFISCVDFVDPDGHVHSWKIEPIEMNIDKYIDAQAKISRIADSSATSGMGLSPALANIIIDGKSDSGSQMLYALKIFYGADTQIAEEIVLEAMNEALRINFPGKELRMGLYRQMINKEDNVTASSRAANQV
jgi:hypothetical protein